MANRFFPNYDTYIITSKFGNRTINGKEGFHNGIDLVAKGNGYGAVDSIMAHTGGIVEECGYNASAGNFIRIRISETAVMSYCHFRDKLPWKKGDKIESGTIIGMMGSTGNSTGAHLHWGISENGQWIDPEPYLDSDYIQPVKKYVPVQLPVIRFGDSGEDVKSMQSLLIMRGFDCGKYGADGKYGNSTKKAIDEFQAENGLHVDSICGHDTWYSLINK